MVRTRSPRVSSKLLKPCSSSRRRVCSAPLATVLEQDLLDSWIRRPANQNSYHQTFPRLNRLITDHLKTQLKVGARARHLTKQLRSELIPGRRVPALRPWTSEHRPSAVQEAIVPDPPAGSGPESQP